MDGDGWKRGEINVARLHLSKHLLRGEEERRVREKERYFRRSMAIMRERLFEIGSSKAKRVESRQS